MNQTKNPKHKILNLDWEDEIHVKENLDSSTVLIKTKRDN